MFGLGTLELTIILVVAVVIFGEKKHTEIGAVFGKGMTAFENGLKETEETVPTTIGSSTPPGKDK